eukprot:s4963_g6.t1
MRARSSRSRSPVGSARLAAHANMSDGDIRELLVLMTARIDDLENSVDGLKAQIRLLGDQIPLQAELEMQIGRNLQRHDRQYDLTVNSIKDLSDRLEALRRSQIGRNLQRHDRQYDLTVNSIKDLSDRLEALRRDCWDFVRQQATIQISEHSGLVPLAPDALHASRDAGVSPGPMTSNHDL